MAVPTRLSYLVTDICLSHSKTMKAELVREICARFGDVGKEPLYAIATLVDPRDRGKLFTPHELANATQRLNDLTQTAVLLSATEPQATTSSAAEPAAKHARLDNNDSLLDLLYDDL